MQQRTVLIVSYQFPPALSPGATRVGKFTKYLPESGWLPTVLTSERGLSLYGKDPTDLESLAGGVELIRVPDWQPTNRVGMFIKKVYRRLAFPDPNILWALRAALHARRALKGRRFDVVFSTQPTISNHLVAASVARRARRPWVAEWRDLWSQSVYQRPWRISKRLERLLERRLLDAPDAVITTSHELISVLGRLAPDLQRKAHVVTNGFDLADRPRDVERDRTRFVIGHGGSLYHGQRDIGPFTRALDDFAARHNEVQVEFLAISAPDDALDTMRLQKSDSWELNEAGTMPLRQALTTLSACDVLLIVTNPAYPELPSKFFDYLLVGRPILVLGRDDSELSERLRASKAGLRADLKDEVMIREALEKLLAERSSGKERRPSLEALAAYDRRVGTCELANVFDSVAP